MQERILIIKHGALGDFMLAIGAMQGIRQEKPGAHITLMTMEMFVGIAQQMACFDDIIVDNRVTYWNIPANYRAISSIVKGKFDVIYDLQESSRTVHRYAPLVRFFTCHDYDWYSLRKENYRIEKTGVGFGKRTELEPAVPRQITDLRFLHGRGEHFDELPERYVVLVPGCSPNHPYKRWAISNYCEIARRLAARGIHSLLLGTKTEEKELTEIAAATPMAVNFMGKNSLLDIPDIARRALACVGNDTGPTHMCSFCKVPVISIFSPLTASALNTPGFSPDSTPMVSPVDDINHITPDDVWKVLEPHLDK